MGIYGPGTHIDPNDSLFNGGKGKKPIPPKPIPPKPRPVPPPPPGPGPFPPPPPKPDPHKGCKCKKTYSKKQIDEKLKKLAKDAQKEAQQEAQKVTKNELKDVYKKEEVNGIVTTVVINQAQTDAKQDEEIEQMSGMDLVWDEYEGNSANKKED